MSRINSILVAIPDNVKLECCGNKLSFQSNKGEKEFILDNSIIYRYEDDELLLSVDDNYDKKNNALLGTYVSNIKNFIYGITKGFSLRLKISGIGYKAVYNGKYLTLSLGFSHDIIYKISEDIRCECIKQDQIMITGVDKQKVHMVASDLCKIRKYNPYKGKGVILEGKIMLRKETSKKK